MSEIVDSKSSHATASVMGGARGVLIAVVASLGLIACGGSSDGNDTDDQNPTTATPMSGSAQKGPFQAGGTATAIQLQADGSLGSASVSGDIASNGGFSLTDADWAGPTQLEMTGVFFNEVVNNFTSDSATLHAAITLPDDASANVNLFTHFAAARTQTLMAAGADFGNARAQARGDLNAIIGISAAPTSLDLHEDNGSTAHQSDSANLLLFSAATLTAGVDQAGIDAIAEDFADDGQINGVGQIKFDEIKQAAADHPDLLATARANMQATYSVVPPDNATGLSPVWVPGAPPLPVASFTFSGSLKAGDPQSFDADTSTGDTLTYAWEFGDGDTATGAQATHVYGDAGNYTAVLTVTDRGNRSDTESRDLAITEGSTTPAPPTAAFNVSGDQVVNQNLTFSAGSSVGADLVYAWTFGDGNMANGAQATHAYTSAGDYSVELTVTDSASQTDTKAQTLTIIASPSTVQKVSASDLTDGDSFGVSVAMDGDTAVIGAEFAEIGRNRDAGSAYVFTRVNGVWSESQQLIASDQSAIDYFGSSVALDGDTIVVGARNADGGGAAYVFTRSNSAWSEQAKLVASDREPGASFGSAVAIEGDTVLVGASGYYKNGAGLQGAAYAFTRTGSSWSQQAKLTAIGGSEPEIAKFGHAVALQGDTAMIGAPFTRLSGNNAEGAVHVFTRSGNSWSHDQMLAVGVSEGKALFGYSVSISGETAVVGQSQGTVGTKTSQGSAYVYDRVAGVWSESQRLIANDGEARDVFGSSVSILNDTILIGAGFADAYARLSGVAYVFTRSGGAWNQQDKLWAEPASQDDRFGYAVTLDGTEGLIGAYTSGTSYIDPGKAYFYDFSDLVSP
ncbi:PKD domain-containing protein [Marinobacter sediminicola]|uniref:PKD domain-containing protein n=1 Tax=Marinobacter sediminicola TaxID=3072994 RepID=UPI002811214C|nr:PKD domain-containing protein [Marinobacter sp. F26243]